MKPLTNEQREQIIKKIVQVAKLNILGSVSAEIDPLAHKFYRGSLAGFSSFILRVDDLFVSEHSELEEDTYTEVAAMEFAKYMTQRMLVFKCHHLKVVQ